MNGQGILIALAISRKHKGQEALRFTWITRAPGVAAASLRCQARRSVTG
jgi:hypothetical protein